MLVQPCGNVQGVDMSKVSAVSKELSLVAEFQLKECTGEDVHNYIVQDQLSQCNRQRNILVSPFGFSSVYRRHSTRSKCKLIK